MTIREEEIAAWKAWHATRYDMKTMPPLPRGGVCVRRNGPWWNLISIDEQAGFAGLMIGAEDCNRFMFVIRSIVTGFGWEIE